MSLQLPQSFVSVCVSEEIRWDGEHMLYLMLYVEKKFPGYHKGTGQMEVLFLLKYMKLHQLD